MARVSLELLEGRAPEEKRALLRALHAALPEGLGVSEEDLALRLVEHPREQFAAPASYFERLTVVVVSAFVRSDAGREHVQELIERAAEGSGVAREDVLVRWSSPADA